MPNTIKSKSSVIISSFAILMYLLFYGLISNVSNSIAGIIKIILCWCGIFAILYIIVSWKNMTGRAVSLYTLFMLFFFMFNFGQCFMWAVGIHSSNEIGSGELYHRLSTPTNSDIVKVQSLVIVGAIMIHFGAINFHRNKSRQTKKLMSSSEDMPESNADRANLLRFSFILLPFVVFSEYYYQISNYINAKTYGYTGLYYNENVQSVNVAFQIIARLFFPVIFGLLYGSNYKIKSIRILAYSLFGIDVILSVMVGDRGGWIYSLLLLLLCHSIFYKKLSMRQIVTLGAIAYAGMIILIAVRNIRNVGVTASGLVNAMGSAVTDPITSTLTEMGGTMSVTLVFVMQGWDIFPYGNSFLYGLLIAPTKRIINILNLNFETISSWLSQKYLGISNGAGFSIVAEVYCNFGPVFFPIIMILVGIIIQKITDIDSCDYEHDFMTIFYKVITCSVIINISRNCFSYNMGEVFYTTLLFWILFTFYNMLIRSGSVVKRGA